jgi:hypothetical protein
MRRILSLLLACAMALATPVAFPQVSVDASKTGVSRSMHLLCSSASAATVTGILTETTLATCSVPAGAMGATGGVQIRTSWTVTNSANSKTLRARFGGVSGAAYQAMAVTSSVAVSDLKVIRNRNSATSQVGSFSAAGFGYGAGSAPLTTSTVDTNAAVDIVISGQLANTGESITLESYEVWLLP